MFIHMEICASVYEVSVSDDVDMYVEIRNLAAFIWKLFVASLRWKCSECVDISVC